MMFVGIIRPRVLLAGQVYFFPFSYFAFKMGGGGRHLKQTQYNTTQLCIECLKDEIKHYKEVYTSAFNLYID